MWGEITICLVSPERRPLLHSGRPRGGARPRLSSGDPGRLCAAHLDKARQPETQIASVLAHGHTLSSGLLTVKSDESDAEGVSLEGTGMAYPCHTATGLLALKRRDETRSPSSEDLLSPQSIIAAVSQTRSLRLRKVKGLPEVTSLGNQVTNPRAWGSSLCPAGLHSEVSVPRARPQCHHPTADMALGTGH